MLPNNPLRLLGPVIINAIFKPNLAICSALLLLQLVTNVLGLLNTKLWQVYLWSDLKIIQALIPCLLHVGRS